MTNLESALAYAANGFRVLPLHSPTAAGDTTISHYRSVQATGSGGFHYLFAPDGVQISRGFRPGLDLLTGPGCYIVVCPSVHASGVAYAWLSGPDPLSVPRDSIELLRAPQWLLDTALGNAPKRERKKRFELPDVIEEGGRNSVLAQLAGSMRRTGMSQDAITAAPKQTNRENAIRRCLNRTWK